MDFQELTIGLQKAEADRTIVDSNLNDIYKYTNNRKYFTNRRDEHREKDKDIFDSTMEMSNIILAAGLSGYMTNASQRWFELRPRDEGLLNQPDVAKFFVNASNILYSVLATSNFYQQIHESYLDVGAAGYSGLIVEEDPTDAVRFSARHPLELYFLEDDKERVNYVYRKVYFTAWQAAEKWGANCCEAVSRSIEQKEFNKKILFIHHIRPRHIRDVAKKDGANKPFASYWASFEDKKIIEVGGYDEMPIMIHRFYKNSEDPYGYGPAWVSLPEAKMLNKAVELWVSRAELDLKPPLITEHDGMIGTINLRGGAINYQRRPLTQGKAIEPLIIGTQYEMGMTFINQTREIISKNFFVDMFLTLLNKPNMTATEVMERSQEKMLILGPFIGRLQNELLNPIIIRTFNILHRKHLLGEIPEVLDGREFDVVYVSPLAKAQRAAQARDTSTFLSIIGQMAQFTPDVLDNINTDEVVKKFVKMLSVDPDVLYDSDVVEAIREAKQQAAQQQQMMAGLQQAGGIAKDFSVAGKNERKMNEQVL